MTRSASLLLALRGTPARDTNDVLTTMRAIEAALVPAGQLPSDGIAWFNRLYLATTEAVVMRLAEDGFAHPAALSDLDVIFANLYFDALRQFASAMTTPRAWRPLFTDDERRDVAPIQFALAGLNAHVNRDLPVALFHWWSDPQVLPLTRGALRADYDHVNAVIAQVQEEAKDRFEDGDWQVFDTVFGRVDDIAANFSIIEARNAAWTHGEVLMDLGGPQRTLGGSFLDSLDGVVGLAGRGLLVPTLIPQ